MEYFAWHATDVIHSICLLRFRFVTPATSGELCGGVQIKLNKALRVVLAKMAQTAPTIICLIVHLVWVRVYAFAVCTHLRLSRHTNAPIILHTCGCKFAYTCALIHII